jgi:outer membrane protein assembly factor BamB
MNAPLTSPAAEEIAAAAPGPVASGNRPRHLWIPVVLVALFWTVPLVVKQLDLPIFAGFFSSVASFGVLALAFTAWWLTAGGARLRDRFLVWLGLIAISVIAGRIVDKSIGGMGLLFFGIPAAITATVVALVLTRNRSSRVRHVGMLAAFAILCGSIAFLRVDGIDGDQQAAVRWRWTTTAEDLYLASRAASPDTATSRPATRTEAPPTVLVAQPGDWTEFRGPDRRAEVHGLKIATDWESHPPKQLWRQRIGPAWSSMLIIGDRLFTQEQRGESEVVLCLDATTGHEVWSHQYKARFFDGQAGAGPRSSPTFSEGRIYTLGASGVLNCLEAANGQTCWSRDIVADSKAPLPMWGFSSSPLVIDGRVIVYAGGPGEKGLLAYRDKTGEPAWSVATGPVSYSSPQVVTVHGQRQVLFLSDTGLLDLEPASGRIVWEHKALGHSVWRVALPRQVDDTGIVIGSEDLGLVRLDLAHATASPRWDSRALRPAYNDFVSQDGFIYGFDESFLCCVDAATGKRRWKAGRYGHGQLLLLTDQHVLLVISEQGEAVLVSAKPDKHEELGRFQAINSKTWNHPAVARGCLFVRNAEEIACYKLTAAK